MRSIKRARAQGRLSRLQYLDVSVNFVGDPNMPNILSWEDVRIKIHPPNQFMGFYNWPI